MADDVAIPYEDTVLDITAEWSVDPTRLGERTDVLEHGLVGCLGADRAT